MLEIGGRPILVLSSRNLARARELCSEAWLLEELASYGSSDEPIWDGSEELEVRSADAREAAMLQAALGLELARGEYEGHVFAFLVPIDPIP